MAEQMQVLSELATPVDPAVIEPVKPRRGRGRKAAASLASAPAAGPASLEQKPAVPATPVVPMAPDAPPAVSIASPAVPKRKPVRRRRVVTPTRVAAPVAGVPVQEPPVSVSAFGSEPKTAPRQVAGAPVTASGVVPVAPMTANIPTNLSVANIETVDEPVTNQPPMTATQVNKNGVPVPVQSSVTPMIQTYQRQFGFRGKQNRAGVNQAPNAFGKATRPVSGFLDTFRENLPVIRVRYGESEEDTFVPPNMMRKYKLQPGDVITGIAREPKDSDRYWGLMSISKINDMPVEEYLKKPRVRFHQLTPVYPDEQLKLETGAEPISTRMVDLIAPIGKGQRSLIVSPPKAGKTSLLKEIATGVAANYPDIFLMAVLIGERPEEVTDLRRHIEKITNGRGEVAASNFDEPAESQCRVAELALERAKRLVEKGMDVVILLDSITRLARAYNLSIPTSGRTLSGGFDPAALFPPKRFFGAARNFEVPGSLTIIGTALVDTGSRMDDLVYEEFKGTGNQELHLDRKLAERRIYPAIEVQKSGTRRDDLLMDPVTYQAVLTLQRMLDTLDSGERTTTLITQMRRSKTNREFLQSLRNS